eukprot:NODE_590_length_5625_cov_0.852515.p6 type:complete len:173 gc:universal NODE_590_length_5625_cov_0.852515:1527-1009(-)
MKLHMISKSNNSHVDLDTDLIKNGKYSLYQRLNLLKHDAITPEEAGNDENTLQREADQMKRRKDVGLKDFANQFAPSMRGRGRGRGGRGRGRGRGSLKIVGKPFPSQTPTSKEYLKSNNSKQNLSWNRQDGSYPTKELNPTGNYTPNRSYSRGARPRSRGNRAYQPRAIRPY